MNTRIIVISVTAIGLLFICLLFLPPVVHVGSQTLSYRGSGDTSRKEEALLSVNRFTGKTYRYSDGSWVEIKKSDVSGGVRLGAEIASQIIGRAGFVGDKLLLVSLYNGSNYRITGITVQVDVECTDKAHDFTRKYHTNMNVEAMSDGEASLLIPKPGDYVSHKWSILAFYGVRQIED